MDNDPIQERFEDIEDMMNHVYDRLDEAVYYYCLCLKVSLPGTDEKFIKAFLLTYIESQFMDTYQKLIPCIEKNGNENLIYGIVRKEP